ncbi:MAG: transcriptional regulator [Lachnospiraceae bacterium]|nr:transcriptional regulator [Lachnospiraceae bacterium]
MNSSDLVTAVRTTRKDLHYTQAFLSEFPGLSICFISDLENGKPTVEFEKALTLVNILGMDLFAEVRE